MLVTHIMSSPVITVARSTPMHEVANLMRDKGVGSVVVTDESGAIVGIVTETDLTAIRRSVPFNLKLAAVLYGMRPPTAAELDQLMSMARTLTAGDLMTAPVQTITEDRPAAEAIELMLRHDRRHIPVVRAGRPVGIVARHDILKMLADNPPAP
jgi:CBS domain-containing protein